MELAAELSLLQASLGARYAIERELGRGGMATVYLARDLRHHRLVALKVLHAELGAVLGAERFLKEIELTAALQHPHILPLFDSGEAGGLLYYVMPLVEGETLRARLAREVQLPIDEAIRIAQQTASALDYAHRRGVVHRDIKPENLLLHDDQVQVADFGIALAVQQAGGQRLTQTGLSLGTPQYMAPEQAMGDKTVGARADVYALGAVTYEMLVGEPPFTGPTAQAVIAKVLTEQPKAPSTLRRSVPTEVDAAVLKALEKLPADRWSSAAAFADALVAPARVAASGGRMDGQFVVRRATAAIVAAFMVAAVALAWMFGRASAPRAAAPRPVRFTIELDSGTWRFGEPAISPDGKTVVYSAEGPDGTQLYARRVDEIAARALPGTENADAPFFSPNGEWVAFYSTGALRKVRLDGGTPVTVAELPGAAIFGGGTWSPDNVIYFAFAPIGTLYRVSPEGGRPSRIAADDSTLRLLGPHALPGGRAILVTVLENGPAAGRIGVLDVASGHLRLFGVGLGARYAAGNVFYVGARALGGQLYRQQFDLRRLAPVGDREQIGDGVTLVPTLGRFGFDVSDGGTVVYHIGRRRYDATGRTLTLVNRGGGEPRVISARAPWEPRVSPDGRRVAYGAFAPGRDSSDLWVTDLASGATQRLTTDGNDNNDPVWSPDGQRIAYDRMAPGGKDVFVQQADGTEGQLLVRRPGNQFPTDWLADGSAVLFTEVSPAGDLDVWVQPLPGGPARPYLVTPAHETAARLSPDGHWVAYQSDETGRDEVYVQSYPTGGRKTVISTTGGANPVWRRDGRELYYWKVDQLMAAQVEGGRSSGPLAVRNRTALFRAPYVENILAMYDVSADGSQFIIVTGDARPGRLVVALDALAIDQPKATAAR